MLELGVESKESDVKLKLFLKTGELLKAGEYLLAKNGAAYATIQPDGNFCVYAGTPKTKGKLLWSLGKSLAGPHFAVMHENGQFCLYKGIDFSHSHRLVDEVPALPGDHAGYFVEIGDDGQFGIYRGKDPTDAGKVKTYVGYLSYLPHWDEYQQKFNYLKEGEVLVSKSGTAYGVLEGNQFNVYLGTLGNRKSLTYQLKGKGDPPHFAVMQVNGQFIIYRGADPYPTHNLGDWTAANDVAAEGQYFAEVEDDGSFSMYMGKDPNDAQKKKHFSEHKFLRDGLSADLYLGSDFSKPKSNPYEVVGYGGQHNEREGGRISIYFEQYSWPITIDVYREDPNAISAVWVKGHNGRCEGFGRRQGPVHTLTLNSSNDVFNSFAISRTDEGDGLVHSICFFKKPPYTVIPADQIAFIDMYRKFPGLYRVLGYSEEDKGKYYEKTFRGERQPASFDLTYANWGDYKTLRGMRVTFCSPVKDYVMEGSQIDVTKANILFTKKRVGTLQYWNKFQEENIVTFGFSYTYRNLTKRMPNDTFNLSAKLTNDCAIHFFVNDRWISAAKSSLEEKAHEGKDGPYYKPSTLHSTNQIYVKPHTKLTIQCFATICNFTLPYTYGLTINYYDPGASEYYNHAAQTQRRGIYSGSGLSEFKNEIKEEPLSAAEASDCLVKLFTDNPAEGQLKAAFYVQRPTPLPPGTLPSGTAAAAGTAGIFKPENRARLAEYCHDEVNDQKTSYSPPVP